MKQGVTPEYVAGLGREVMEALRPGGSWTATIEVVRALGHPEPAVLGKAVGDLLRDFRVAWATGDLGEFPNEAWALAELSDADWKALKAGAERAGGLPQYAFRSFLARVHRSGVKDVEIRYMKQFFASVVEATRGQEFMPSEHSKLQLLRVLSAEEREDRHQRASREGLSAPPLIFPEEETSR